ncbi:MAG: hypothetical protein Q8905_10915 [Bacteroidota bacterium]|nr:hypothetical protein [Bacteroidota bacterium]
MKIVVVAGLFRFSVALYFYASLMLPLLIDLGLPGDYFPVLCPLLTPLRLSSFGCPIAYPVSRNS